MKLPLITYLLPIILFIAPLLGYALDSYDVNPPNPLVAYEQSSPESESHPSAAWQEFVTENPGWSCIWNPRTMTPHRALGTPIHVPGFSRATEDNVEQIARTFLKNYPELIAAKDIALVSKRKVLKNWYLLFQQTISSYPIYRALIHVRISPDARIILFGSDALKNVPDFLQPTFSQETALTMAKHSLWPVTITQPHLSEDNPLIVLPSCGGIC